MTRQLRLAGGQLRISRPQEYTLAQRVRRATLSQPIVMMNLMICHNWHDGKTPELREDLISLGTRLETDSPMPEPRRTRGLSTKPFVTVRTSRTRVCTGAINEDSTLKGREIFVEIVPFVFHWPIGH